jgi:hypothetical protein
MSLGSAGSAFRNPRLTPGGAWVIFSNIEITFGFSKLKYSQNLAPRKPLLICQQTLLNAQPGRREVSKATFVGHVTDLIVPDESSPAPRPQAFLVEQSANWTLPTHFHQEHQFQVFVGGGGTIGRNPVDRLAVHYASPHSGYGPLISGDEGISYFTLRAVGDQGAWYLPEQREQLMLRIKKKQAHAKPGSYVDLPALRALAQPYCETLIEPEDSGLAAWLVRLPAGRHAQVPQPELATGGGGRFLVVTQGSLLSRGEELPGLATLFVSREETFALQAGANGAELLVLQFPAEAAQSFVEQMTAAPTISSHEP